MSSLDWQALIDTLPCPALLLSADGRVEKANSAGRDLWQAGDEPEFLDCGAGSFRLQGPNKEGFSARATVLADGRRLVVLSPERRAASRKTDIRQRAELSNAVLDAVSDPIYVKDAQLRYVAVNRAYARRWGSEPCAMVGKRSSDFATPESAARFEASERQVLATGDSFDDVEECEIGGVSSLQSVRKARLGMPDGQAYVAGFISDISEYRRREQEALEARRHLAEVLDTMPAGIVIFDRNDRLVLANRLIQNLLPGLKGKWTPGTPLRDALLEGRSAGYFRSSGDGETDGLWVSHPEAWVERYARLYHRTNAVWEREHPDGKWFQVFDTRTADGTYVGVRLDISEIKLREEQLRRTLRENELFQSLIDNIPVSIYAKRPDLRLTYVNKGWCDLVGRSREDAIGRTDVELFGAQGEAFRDGDLEVLRTGQARMIEETATWSDGGKRHHIARKGVMTASDGSVYLIGSTTEITELKEREEELREARRCIELADKVKSEFLSNMGREIRTPMNGVLGMAELLARTELDARQRAFVDIIVKSGNALVTMVNDILDFAQIDAGQMTLDASPFDLGEAIDDVASLLSARAREKDLQLDVRVDPALARRFVGDAGRFRQIVTNLVGNAVKFTEVGRVTVNVSGEHLPDTGSGPHTCLTVSVADTGIGIPADKLDHVFEKFAQVDATPTRRHEGTGLGLAITARLAALMGGRIDVRSTAGKGSTFSVTLTLPEAEDRKPAQPARDSLAGARVLVIAADPSDRKTFMEQVRNWGADGCAACNAAEALGVLASAAALDLAVDCVILDGQMQASAGLDTAALIRGIPSVARTPLVLLASEEQPALLAAADPLAFAARLAKPVNPAALRQAVAKAVGQRMGKSPAQKCEETVARGDQRATASPETPATSQTHRIDILIAEDNEVNQLVFMQILAGTAYAFQIVGNGRLACEAFRDMNPRVILMDIAMPEMDGLEACAAIRRMQEAGKRVPIVGVITNTLNDDRARCLDAGMDDCLPKPISPRALLEKVEYWAGSAERSQVGLS